MQPATDVITDIDAGADRLRQRSHGMIVTTAGRLHAIYLRRWPKLISLPETWPVGARYHAAGRPDLCRLYYNQPRSMPNFLALKYIVSTRKTSYATFRAALAALDSIAERKRIDAIVCDVGNVRLSDRLLRRLGWQPHKPQRWHRNYIRRFYGQYPAGPGQHGGPAGSFRTSHGW